MGRNHWPNENPANYIENPDGTCDMPKVSENIRKRSKYGNQIIHDPEYGLFHSVGEHKRWYELLWLQKAGEISELTRQIPYVLCDAEILQIYREVFQLHKITYIADFQYVENGHLIVEDYKSPYTANFKEWRLKKALFVYRYPDIILREEIR